MVMPLHERPHTFYPVFDRKDGDGTTTHYCPGCGHGNVHKFVAEAIEDLGLADRTIFVNPVGCSVFAYYYLDFGHIQAPHGRAPAVATAVKRAHPESLVICYQGDGDLAAIGGNEILQAANRGESLTVIFINNAIYGMTGGQMAPTSLLGQVTTTTPRGRAVEQEGSPLRVCELLASLQAPAYLERVALGDAKHDMAARKAIRRAIQNQVEGRGFSLVEVLSPCPTGWKVSPPEAAKFVLETMTRQFPLGRVRGEADAASTPQRPITGLRLAVDPERIAGILGLEDPSGAASAPAGRPGVATAVKEILPRAAVGESTPIDTTGGSWRPSRSEIPRDPAGFGEIETRYRNPRIKAAGFGGQGVLFLGALIAEAGMHAGMGVSWLPSYGPEMRGGTAHCHVILSETEVDSPLVTRASVLFAFNRPSLERFAGEVIDGGVIVYDSSLVGDDLPSGLTVRVETIGLPATTIAESLGSARVANIVALGAWVGRTRILAPAAIEAALSAHHLKPEVVALNMRALEAGIRTQTTASA